MTAEQEPAISVRHLSHRFGSFEVLRDVSFDVHHGEIFGFIGPNGAGKTTTIRVLSTLLEPLAGRVKVLGHDVTLEPDVVRQHIGYMPDQAGVYDRVTVREYLEFFADAYHVPTAGSSYAVVDASMELTDLTRLSDKIVSTMSKGMKQRLQLARVLLHDPKVLILDEPASDLDPRARIEIRDLLMELRAMGKTILLSSHILTELADVVTSVAIMERGRIVVAGPIGEISEALERQRRGQRTPPPQVPHETGTPHAHAPAPEPPRVVERSVKLRVLAPFEQVKGVLTELPFVTSVRPGSMATMQVTFSGDDSAVAYMVRALVVADLQVVSVEPERNELERIFLEATRGDLQ
jgi:ABC-2 type transport system ATP-binding protein